MSEIHWTPGTRVMLAGSRDWGIGQVQSAAQNLITVNFEHAGKRVINIDHASLVAVSAVNGVETAEHS